jgi:hypothetical protein
MTPSLPQRIPRTPSAPAIQGDPHWYAAIAQALRATPAARFPCLNDLIPRRPPASRETCVYRGLSTRAVWKGPTR